MAIELGTGYVSLVPSAKGFGAAISRQIGGDLRAAGTKGGEDFGTGMRSRLGTAFSTVGKLAAGAGVAIGAGMLAGGGFGLKLAAQTETASIGFTTLLGSSQKAGAYLDQLKAFAAKTPFDFPTLRDAASRFLAVGVEANRVIPIMETLGDATAAMGTGSEGIDRATTALTQMAQKGKVQAEEMLQLTEAGIPAWDALASVLGTDVAGAQKAVTDGQVTANQVFEALETKAGPALQRVSGLMQQQATTLEGLFSTLKDTVSQQLATALSPAITVIKAQLPGITDAIGSALGSIGPGLTNLFSGVAKVIPPILAAVTPLAGVLANVLGAAMQAIAPAISVLAPAFASVASVVGAALVPAISSLAPLLETVASVISALAPLVAPVAQVVGVLAQAFSAALSPVLGSIAMVLRDLVATVLPPLSAAFSGIAPVIISIADTIGRRLGLVLRQLAPVLGEVASILLDSLATAFDAIRPVLPELADSALTLAEALAPLAATVLPPLAEGIALLVQAITPLAPIMPQLVAGFLAFKAASTGFNLASTIAGPLGQVRTLISGVANVAATQGVSGFAAFRQAIASSVRESAGFQKLSQLKSTVGSIGSALKTGASAMADFGKKAALAAVGLAKQTAAFVAQKAASVAAAVATKALAIAQGVLNAVMAVNPFVLIVVGIAALVAGLVLAYNKVGWFRDLVDTAFSFIQDVIGTLVGFVSANWPILLAVMTGGLGIAVALIVDNWSTISDIFTSAISAIVGFVQSYWPIIFAVLTGGLSLVVGFVISNWSTITSIFSTALNLILSVITTVVSAVVAFWQAEWQLVVAIATFVWGAITGAVSAGLGFVRGAFNGFAGAFMVAWNGFWNGLAGTVSAIAGAVASAFSAVVGGIKAVWNGFVSAWNGFSVGFNIPEVDLGPLGSIGGGHISIDLPNLPRLATGAVIEATPTGTLALLGEGGRNEAVVPFSSLRLSDLFAELEVPKGGTTRQTNFNGDLVALDPSALARQVVLEEDWADRTAPEV